MSPKGARRTESPLEKMVQQPQSWVWCLFGALHHVPSNRSLSVIQRCHPQPIFPSFALSLDFQWVHLCYIFRSRDFLCKEWELSWSCFFPSVRAWTDFCCIITQFPFQFHSRGNSFVRDTLLDCVLLFLLDHFLSIGVYPKFGIFAFAHTIIILPLHHILPSAWIERLARDTRLDAG